MSVKKVVFLPFDQYLSLISHKKGASKEDNLGRTQSLDVRLPEKDNEKVTAEIEIDGVQTPTLEPNTYDSNPRRDSEKKIFESTFPKLDNEGADSFSTENEDHTNNSMGENGGQLGHGDMFDRNIKKRKVGAGIPVFISTKDLLSKWVD